MTTDYIHKNSDWSPVCDLLVCPPILPYDYRLHQQEWWLMTRAWCSSVSSHSSLWLQTAPMGVVIDGQGVMFWYVVPFFLMTTDYIHKSGDWWPGCDVLVCPPILPFDYRLHLQEWWLMVRMWCSSVLSQSPRWIQTTSTRVVIGDQSVMLQCVILFFLMKTDYIHKNCDWWRGCDVLVCPSILPYDYRLHQQEWWLVTKVMMP